MSFAGKVWRLLVGIKDALALAFLLLFFGTLFAVLSARPNPGVSIADGALLLRLDGSVVEERSTPDPFNLLLSGQIPEGEYAARDIVRALDLAARDDRIKAVVLDLSTFLGGGHVHMQDIGAALDRVRAAEKPVLSFGLAYSDDSLALAAHSSEIWVDPLGGAMVRGPGGNRQYFAGLMDRFNVNARIYRVGTYKSAVEPYMRSDMSPEARENAQALYDTIWEEWQANVKKARPDADLDLVAQRPVEWLEAHQGDTAQAALAAGLVDTLGDWEAFGNHVAEIVGEDRYDSAPGNFAHNSLRNWLSANPVKTPGKAIGVITVAGEIVDGDAGPGEAGGSRIAGLLDDALQDDLAALVVRVDSPGGSVTASEEIRRAIARHKARGIPIAVSMGNVAASGGYWVSTPADRIFAEPETITGSIGIFGWVPTFEQTLADYGVNSDGVRTTPLSGQPDPIGGFTPEVDAVLQMTIEHGYHQFISLVAESRGKSLEEVDRIAQGRVWDGGTARQLGLVDQFGGIDDALNWAAKQAKLEEGGWHADYLGGKPDEFEALIMQLLNDGQREQVKAYDMFGLIAREQARTSARIGHDLSRLLGTSGAQALCLECPPAGSLPARTAGNGTLPGLLRWLAD